ncbi:hypothetical protein K438DRAFT_1771675 [Mycena galopus ATCC 62051]|nr:hypothetical protein K438DRAFT_1771675 [Mycena galopus ATCC 62051]
MMARGPANTGSRGLGAVRRSAKECGGEETCAHKGGAPAIQGAGDDKRSANHRSSESHITDSGHDSERRCISPNCPSQPTLLITFGLVSSATLSYATTGGDGVYSEEERSVVGGNAGMATGSNRGLDTAHVSPRSDLLLVCQCNCPHAPQESEEVAIALADRGGVAGAGARFGGCIRRRWQHGRLCLLFFLVDPLAKADATTELMTWYRERQKLAVDKRKAAGHGMALLRKVAEPFIHQSTSISNIYDIDIFGCAVDRFTDTAHIWGGSKPFSDANTMYPGDIQQDLFNWKARLQLANFFMHNSKTASNYLLTDRNVQMEHCRQANVQDEATQAMQIDFTRVKNESNRDRMRRQLSRLFLNPICTSSFPLVPEVASGNPVLVLIMLAREDNDLASIQNLFKKGFPWKWTTVARRQKLRFEGWPAALKSSYPGPGFDLSHIKDSDAPVDASRNKAMRDMHTTLKVIYLGTAEDAIQCTKIVSWTEDEQELDDPGHVAIVTCDDGTTLLTAAACTKLFRDLASAKPKKSGKGKRKAAADESAAGPSKRAHSLRPAPSRTPTPSHSPMPTPPASRSVTPPPHPRQVPDSPAAEEPS